MYILTKSRPTTLALLDDKALTLFEVKAGVNYPNNPENVPFKVPFTSTEAEAFRNNKLYLVIYGTVTYTDFFKVQHWTKFCYPFYETSAPALSCAQYNGIDTND